MGMFGDHIHIELVGSFSVSWIFTFHFFLFLGGGGHFHIR